MSDARWSEETDMFLSALSSQRRHVLGILDGLGEEELRQPVLPSGWSCLSLVRHLALDVERFWFRGTVAGEKAVVDEVGDATEDGWHLSPQDTADDVLTLYRREIDRADEIIAATPLDAAPMWWPDFFGDYRLANVREVIVHVLSETACHAGHLDAARELIDGRQWMVLD